MAIIDSYDPDGRNGKTFLAEEFDMKWLLSVMAAAVVCVGSWCWADTVYLQDGGKVDGKVTSVDGAPVVVVETPLGVREFRMSMVDKIVKGAAAAGSTTPAATSPTSQPTGTETASPTLPTNIDPATRAKYVEAMKNADKAASGADGLAIWTQFLADVPTGPLADQAKTQQSLWKGRADKNQVRFGPGWLEKDKVDAKSAKADEFVGKADSAKDANEAADLLTKAAAENPYRVDIPFKKAMLFHKAGNLPKFGKALGEVVAKDLDPNNVVARNDLGVISALNKDWGGAVANLLKASVYADTDIPLDNLDQAIALAEADGLSADKIAAFDQQVRAAVEKLHRAKKHEGEQRWGNTWIKQDQYDKYTKENTDIDKQIARDQQLGESDQRRYVAAQRDIAAYNSYIAANTTSVPGIAGTTSTVMTPPPAQLTTAYTNAQTNMPALKADAAKLQKDIDALKAKKNVPAHADKLVLLNPEGGELESKPAKAEPKTDTPK